MPEHLPRKHFSSKFAARIKTTGVEETNLASDFRVVIRPPAALSESTCSVMFAQLMESQHLRQSDRGLLHTYPFTDAQKPQDILQDHGEPNKLVKHPCVKVMLKAMVPEALAASATTSRRIPSFVGPLRAEFPNHPPLRTCSSCPMSSPCRHLPELPPAVPNAKSAGGNGRCDTRRPASRSTPRQSAS